MEEFSSSKPKIVDCWSFEIVYNEYIQRAASSKSKNSRMCDDPIVKNYLVSPCDKCTEDPCLNYHSNQKPRREVFATGPNTWNYKSIRCERSLCSRPDCAFAHTNEEV